METRHLRDLLPLVLPHVPGCPEMVATLNLRLSAIDFCERTKCWRHVATETLVDGDLIVVTPDFASIHEIEHAEMNGTDLIPIAYTDSTNSKFQAGSAPRYITQVNPGTLMVLPEGAGDLTVSLFLKPRNDEDYGRGDLDGIANYFDQIPEFIHQQHGEAIAAGAIARLMIQPGTPWSAPPTAAFWQSMFMDKANRTTSGSVRGQQRAPVRSKTMWM